MGHVFISYVRENEREVVKLGDALRAYGLSVWLDREQIHAGQRWRNVIRRAIRQGGYFIACFSEEYFQRDRSFMNEELTFAIEELRNRPIDRAWFIPVRLSDCELPDRDVGAGQTLQDIQWVDLFDDWDAGIQKLAHSLTANEPEIPESHVDQDRAHRQVSRRYRALLPLALTSLGSAAMIAGLLYKDPLAELISKGMVSADIAPTGDNEGGSRKEDPGKLEESTAEENFSEANEILEGRDPEADFGKARRLLEEACNQGHALACNHLGYMHEYGLGMEPDIDRAQALYHIGCDADIGLSCTNLALLYKKSNYNLAIEFFEQAAEIYDRTCGDGVTLDCYALAALLDGSALPKDDDRALLLYERACDGDVGIACNNLALLLEKLDPSGSGAKVIHLHEKSCNLNTAQGCFNLGLTYDNALGVQADHVQAENFYRKACDLGLPDACNNLGNIYSEGKGDVPKHLMKAAAVYNEACEGGSALGCANLGSLYYYGKGVAKDWGIAYTLFEKGCEAGAEQACGSLRAMQTQGY